MARSSSKNKNSITNNNKNPTTAHNSKYLKPKLTFRVLWIILEGDVAKVEHGCNGGVDGQSLLVSESKVAQGLVHGGKVLHIIQHGIFQGALLLVVSTLSVCCHGFFSVLAAEVLGAALAEVLEWGKEEEEEDN